MRSSVLVVALSLITSVAARPPPIRISSSALASRKLSKDICCWSVDCTDVDGQLKCNTCYLAPCFS
jgi:hypothetical protein